MTRGGETINDTTEAALLIERRGRILILTLNRPSAGNSLNPELAQSLDAALEMAEKDADIYAVILTGAGNRIFCGGVDLKHLALYGSKGIFIEGRGLAGLTERFFSKPLICAVNGYAMGGGTELALACDLIVASENAKFGLPEIKRGVYAVGGGPIRLMRAIPKAAAMELLLTGDALTAQRALEIGLINRVFPCEQLLEEAVAMAERIICNAPLAVIATKELAYKSAGLSLEEAFRLNGEITARISATEDAREGPRAFAEKRAPVWKGR